MTKNQILKTFVNLFVAVSCLVPLPLFAGGAVGNGGGDVEADFVYVYIRLEAYVSRTIRERATNGIRNDEEIFLQKLLGSLPNEKKASEALLFDSESKKFEWEVKCDELKLAYTGSKVGDPIHLNLSLFYKNEPAPGGEKKRVRAITFAKIVQILVHELGHHLDYPDHTWLDAVGAKVAITAEQMVKDEAKAIADFRNSTQRTPVPVELEIVREGVKAPRRQMSGVVLPHAINLDGTVELFFVPFGEAKAYSFVPLLADTKRINQALKSFENRSYLPFEGELEGILGVLLREASGKQTLIPSERDPNAFAVADIQVKEASEAIVDRYGLYGGFRLNSKREPYLEVFDRDKPKGAAPRAIALNNFIRPQQRQALIEDIQKRGTANGFVFFVDTWTEETKPDIVSYLLNRHRRQ